MSRDYKPTARKEKTGGKGSPFFTGILVGLLLGVGISVAVALFIYHGESPFVHKEAGKRPETSANEDKDAAPSKESRPDASEKTRFDFYTILPGSESQVTEQEIRQKEKRSEENTVVKENYFLQVGAFQTEQEADNMKARLALLGMEAIVQTANIPDKGIWHRVRVGPYTDLEQINKFRGELVQNGFDPVLVKVHSKSSE